MIVWILTTHKQAIKGVKKMNTFWIQENKHDAIGKLIAEIIRKNEKHNLQQLIRLAAHLGGLTGQKVANTYLFFRMIDFDLYFLGQGRVYKHVQNDTDFFEWAENIGNDLHNSYAQNVHRIVFENNLEGA